MSAMTLFRKLSGLTLGAALSFLVPGAATGTTLYWDQNGIVAGWGGNAGTWANTGGSSNWTTDSTGLFADGGISQTTSNDDLFIGTMALQFGNNAGPTISGDVYAKSLTVIAAGNNRGSFLTGGTIRLGNSGFTINNPSPGSNFNAGISSAWILEAGAGVSTYFINNDKQVYYQGGFTLSGSLTGASDLVIQCNDIPPSPVGFSFSDATTGVNVTGAVTNSGIGGKLDGAATHVLIAKLGANVTGVTQNSANSAMAIESFAATFNGPLTVNAGILRVANSLYGSTVANITTSKVTVASGGTFALKAGGAGIPPRTLAPS